MTRDRLVSVFVALTAAAVAVMVWAFVFHPQRVVHDRPVVTTPIVSSPLTPLRDSGPKNNPRVSSSRRNKSDTTIVQPTVSSTPGARNRPLSTPRTKRPKTTHKPSGGAQKPNPAPQPPSPQPKPPVDVTVPAPVTVCVRPAGGINC